MARLICDFESLESTKSEIKTLIENYNLILKDLVSLESSTFAIWKSESQKAYYNKFMERKADLEQLSVYYDEMIAFLDSTLKTYQNIENKY